MKELLLKIAQKLGIDKAIAFTSGNGVINAVIGVVSVFIYTTCISKEEQGYLYTFNSVMAIKVFFELGFTGIITQYVAHEHAHLNWAEDGVGLLGEDKYKSRLSSLLHFCMKWYSVIAIVYFIVLQVAGIYFFSTFGRDDSVSWKIPWIFISLFSAIGLFQAPIFSFTKGLGLVKEMAEMGFYVTIVSTLVSWGCFIYGFALYSIIISSFISTLYSLYYFFNHKLFKIIVSIWRIKVTEKVSYMKEIFPFQWRIALSWISGYFIFNFINPVVFATSGAVAAGQMGMTVNILNQIRSFAMAWIGTKVPLMSRMIALKDYLQLDRLFKKTVLQELFIAVSLLLIFWCCIFVLRLTQLSINGRIVAERFLDYLPMLLMTIPVIAQMINDNLATYLRCHKREPYLLKSVCIGLLSVCYILICSKYFGLIGICTGYCIIFTLISLPWGIIIFAHKRKEWHGRLI